LWGVLWTDLFQFVLKMGIVIGVAYYAIQACGGMNAVIASVQQMQAHAGANAENPLNFLPNFSRGVTSEPMWMVPLANFFVFIGLQWWAFWYPGAEPGGGGYIAQRIFSARTERDGVLATLWFNVAQYAVRPWPWILTALAVVVIYPGIGDPATAYLTAVVRLLPTGLKGLLVAAFAAAYMSTIATQLNWGASYLINDIYLRYVRPDAPQRRVIWVSRAATAFMFLLSAIVTYWLYRAGSIEGAWRIIIALGAGTGLVMILRWYWWRITAWTEISAMAAALVAFSALTLGGVFDPTDPLQGAYLMLVTTAITTVTWIVVTYLTPPTPAAKLEEFYQRVRPGGPGWRPMQRALGYGAEPIAGGALAWTNWVAGVISVYATLFGVGKLIFHDYGLAALFLAVAGLAFAWIAWSLRRTQPWRLPEPDDGAAPAPPSHAVAR
jgi:SSS family solute:Na+ symporter